MISYEDLCAALDRYNARSRGEAVQEPAPGYEPPTAEHAMPPVGNEDEEALQPVYDLPSNEIDVGDDMVDEELPKN